jgi:hypothetical protein
VAELLKKRIRGIAFPSSHLIPAADMTGMIGERPVLDAPLWEIGAAGFFV